jgi:2-oxoglutarate dioxygenase / 2-oxoglutarate/L-arginine monooxygenase/decarboxylase
MRQQRLPRDRQEGTNLDAPCVSYLLDAGGEDGRTEMAELLTFQLPEIVNDTGLDARLGREMIKAWQRDGIFQVAATREQVRTTEVAVASSKRFFQQPMQVKASRVSDLSYSGYIASGEEVTAGEADYSEIFTVTKDLPLTDPRVQAGWPCHGPAPWPDQRYQQDMHALMDTFAAIGEKLLKLVALGLELKDTDTLTNLTRDGWHHMRVLRFPAKSERTTRGIGAHTDYGLLVIAYQDDVGGLYIRPPIQGEQRPRNWLPQESAAGVFENDEGWQFVTPVPNVFTVFPGDIMQFLTDGALLSTPHKVTLADRDRYAMAYFHEPNFNAVVRPFADPTSEEHIHYGTHFTNMALRNYPDRITTKRIHAENRLSILTRLSDEAAQHG